MSHSSSPVVTAEVHRQDILQACSLLIDDQSTKRDAKDAAQRKRLSEEEVPGKWWWSPKRRRTPEEVESQFSFLVERWWRSSLDSHRERERIGRAEHLLNILSPDRLSAIRLPESDLGLLRPYLRAL